MINKLILSLLCLVVFTTLSNSQSLENLKEINKTWEKFYLAFDSLNYRPMAEIHSKELVRIAGGETISDYDSYISSYKTRFKVAREQNAINNISLRFFERINNDSTASERGIYRLKILNKQGTEQTYFGQFHVIFKKVNGVWKIVMDYDSNEGGTIGVNDYNKAQAIDDFNKFVRN